MTLYSAIPNGAGGVGRLLSSIRTRRFEGILNSEVKT